MLIDSHQILSRLHILAAAYRAVNDALEERLKSRNIHSEIVFSLSMNNNVRHSFLHLLHTHLLLLATNDKYALLHSMISIAHSQSQTFIDQY